MDNQFTFNNPTEPIEFRSGDAKPVYDYQGFAYRANVTADFAALVKAKASHTESCVVFYHDKGYHAILDDGVIDRDQDTVRYDFTLSTQFKEWAEILTAPKVFCIKDFADFIKRREPDEIDDAGALLHAVTNFRYVTSIQGDFTFEDRNNYTFNVKINEAETTVRVPKVITANIEMFQESGFVQPMEVEIEVHRPANPSEKPGFLLSCPKFARYAEQAKKHEVEALKSLLGGYLIVAGYPQQ